ncbi:hypothetical protein WJX79_010666 [Trebouxia sp. C0005]
MKMISCFRGQQNVSEPEVQTLRVALRAKEQRIDRQEEELRTCWQRINNLEALAQLQSSVEAFTATVQQQQIQHAAAAEAQHRQLHAFNLALLEQAEELAALQALLGAPAKKRQSMTSKRRVTEDLITSLDQLQATSGDPATSTLSQSHTSGQQDGVAVPKANAMISISETDVMQANPGKQSTLWDQDVKAKHGAELISATRC